MRCFRAELGGWVGRALGVPLTVLAVVLAACSGGEPAASPRTPTEVRPEPAPASETRPAATRPPSASPARPQPSEMVSQAPSESVLELPREGLPGSLSAMAEQPAATAAATNPLLTTLSAAIERAELVDTLNGPGPFTVFAPTDDAFAAVPSADLDALLADRNVLGDLLTAHVVAGEALDRATLVGTEQVETVDGGTIVFGAADETLSLNGNQATIVMADIQVANGVVHLIDGVLSAQE